MPVVARLNSVVCACKSKQCRVDAVDACVFDTATLASSSVFTPLAKLLLKRAHTSRTHTSRIESSLPGLHNPRREEGAAGAALRRSRRDARAPGAVEASRVQAHAGPRRPRSRPRREQLPALGPIPHLGSTDTGARRERRAATAPTPIRGSRTPPPRDAGRSKQRKRWRPPSSRSARRRRRVPASSRSASGLIKRRRSSSGKGGARPSRPAARTSEMRTCSRMV